MTARAGLMGLVKDTQRNLIAAESLLMKPPQTSNSLLADDSVDREVHTCEGRPNIQTTDGSVPRRDEVQTAELHPSSFTSISKQKIPQPTSCNIGKALQKSLKQLDRPQVKPKPTSENIPGIKYGYVSRRATVGQSLQQT
jgi:hypothetical protein